MTQDDWSKTPSREFKNVFICHLEFLFELPLSALFSFLSSFYSLICILFSFMWLCGGCLFNTVKYPSHFYSIDFSLPQKKSSYSWGRKSQWRWRKKKSPFCYHFLFIFVYYVRKQFPSENCSNTVNLITYLFYSVVCMCVCTNVHSGVHIHICSRVCVCGHQKTTLTDIPWVSCVFETLTWNFPSKLGWLASKAQESA